MYFHFHLASLTMALLFNLAIVIFLPLVLMESQSFYKKWSQDAIVPNIIPKLPEQPLKLIYPSSISIKPGQYLSPSIAQYQPLTIWPATNLSTYHTLVMIDPDSPKPENATRANSLYWLVINIPWNNEVMGDVLAPYGSPVVYQDSAPHRMLFLVYEQAEKLPYNGPITARRCRDNRSFWSLTEFVEEAKLIKLKAGNYYKCGWSPFVEVIKNHTGFCDL